MNAAVLARRLDRDCSSFRRRLAVLADYRLMFNKMSLSDPLVGYANVMPAPGHRVEGILNDLDDVGLARLDAIELVPHHYTRSLVAVCDVMNATLISAEIYTAHPAWIRDGLQPLRSYLDCLTGGGDLLTNDYMM